MANYHIVLKNLLQDYLSSHTYGFPTRDYNISFTLMEADGRKKIEDGNLEAGLAYAQAACFLGKWFDETFVATFVEAHGLQNELVRSILMYYRVSQTQCWEAAVKALRWFIKGSSMLPHDQKYDFQKCGDDCLVDQYDTLHLCRTEEEHLILPEGIRSINRTAFEKETIENLRSITLPSSIGYIHFNSFDRCDNLENIYIPSGHDKYCSIDGVLFDASGEKLMLYPLGRCGEYEVPDHVTALNYYSFNKAKITHVTLPNGLKIIDEGAFSCCQGLTHIRIPASVETIEAFAFEGCTNLISVTFLNKDTQMVGVDHFEEADNVVFYCHEHSAAAEYASYHGIPCFPLEKEASV